MQGNAEGLKIVVPIPEPQRTDRRYGCQFASNVELRKHQWRLYFHHNAVYGMASISSILSCVPAYRSRDSGSARASLALNLHCRVVPARLATGVSANRSAINGKGGRPNALMGIYRFRTERQTDDHLLEDHVSARAARFVVLIALQRSHKSSRLRT